jgi:uncharacterized protein with GYD domain
MGTYIMVGQYTTKGIKAISRERTDEAVAVIEQNGGSLKAGYALLGESDLLCIVEFPGTEQAMKASVALTKLLGISFTTAPALSIEEFDKLFE